MEVIKTSEKIVIWLHREGISRSQVAKLIGITRQAFSQKIKSNVFTINDISVMQGMGFKD